MKIKLVILFALFICMVACGKKTEDSQEEKTVMVLATFEGSTILKTQVEQYNQKNADYRIEIKHYERSEDPKEDGILLLQREIVLGEGPDLIDFGNGYTTSDIVGGYTEDLFLYLDEKERQAYFENMVEAFSYREKLYALPLGFCLESFVGTKHVFCKYFLAKVAKYFWRMLHLQIGESCKASTGSCPASRIAIADQI